MKILVACEYSGIVRDAFASKGHDAWSCDILPTESPGKHLQGDVLNYLNDDWDMMIAHPPCTYISNAGARHLYPKGILNEAINKIALENPVSIISSKIRKPDQIVQPYFFGDTFTKTTCLWLKNLPKLKISNFVDKGEFVIHGGKKIAKWYSNRERNRDKTFPGMAKAMADQWGTDG